jgi:hypothetical protein
MVQVANYDQAGRPSKEVIADQLYVLRLHETASTDCDVRFAVEGLQQGPNLAFC